MARIAPIQIADADGKAKQLLEQVQAKLGKAPNMVKTMAHSPATLEGYLGLAGALSGGKLDPKFREQLALTISQANACEYCLAAHSTVGKMVGLKPEEILAARKAHGVDAKTEAGLGFAQTVVFHRGLVNDSAIQAVRDAGFTEGEITEIIAHVALNLFTNYFNHIAQTDVDFPRVSLEVE